MYQAISGKLHKLDPDSIAFGSDKEFRAICNYHLVHKPSTSKEMPSPVIEAVSMHTNAVPEHMSQPPHCQA